MNSKFDELVKGMAQSVTRRQALRRLGTGMAGMALACLGFANKPAARGGHCHEYNCLPACPKGTKCTGDQFTGCICL